MIPASTADQVRALPGVGRADPITARFVVLDLHGSKQFTFLIANERDGLGGPWRLGAGRRVEADDEIVIDRTLAEQHDIPIGGRIEVMGTSMRVVGLSEGARSWMAGFVFISPAAARTASRRRPRGLDAAICD